MHPVEVNGRRVGIPVGESVEVPQSVLEVLDRAPGIVYRRVDDANQGSRAAPASPKTEGRVFGLPDRPVADLKAALGDLSPAELARLLQAEHNGNTRKTAIAAIEAEMANRQDQE